MKDNAFIVFIWEETATFEIIKIMENVIRKENDFFIFFVFVCDTLLYNPLHWLEDTIGHDDTAASFFFIFFCSRTTYDSLA